MSLETALEKLADAILAHADALRSSGPAKTTITNSVASSDSGKSDAKGDPKDDPERVVYWENEDGTFGTCAIAAYRKLTKPADHGYSLLDIDAYKERCKAAKKKEADNKAAADKAAKAKSDAKAKADAEKKDADGDITDEDLGLLVKPFAGVEDPKERTRRVNWLKDLFSRYGIKKATDLDQSQRGEFVAIVQQAVEAVEDDEGADLPDLDDMDGLV